MKPAPEQTKNKITTAKHFFSNLIGRRAIVIMSSNPMPDWKIIYPHDDAEMGKIRLNLSNNNENFLVFHSLYIGNIFTYVDRFMIQIENLSKHEVLYFNDSNYSMEYLSSLKIELKQLIKNN